MNRALLVGVNKYKMAGSNLRGCVNDVKNVRDMLMKYFDFRTDDVRVLTDRRATLENILARLDWLVKDAKAGDRLLFHFSGHGSQIRDRNGDELADGLDEILCPHDLDWDGIYITDDDLAEILGTVPDGVILEVWLDCCHSGTGTRDVRTTARYLPPPEDIRMREDPGLSVHQMLRGFGPVLLAGCSDRQTSADACIGGEYQGAFTHHLCKILRANTGVITRGETIRQLQSQVKAGGFDQLPQLECTGEEKERRVLG